MAAVLTLADIDEICSLYEAGWDVTEIADEFQVSRQTVQLALEDEFDLEEEPDDADATDDDGEDREEDEEEDDDEPEGDEEEDELSDAD